MELYISPAVRWTNFVRLEPYGPFRFVRKLPYGLSLQPGYDPELDGQRPEVELGSVLKYLGAWAVDPALIPVFYSGVTTSVIERWWEKWGDEHGYFVRAYLRFSLRNSHTELIMAEPE